MRNIIMNPHSISATITTVAHIIISSDKSSTLDRSRWLHDFICITLRTQQRWLLIGRGELEGVCHAHIHGEGVVSEFVQFVGQVQVVGGHNVHIFICVAR